MPQPKRIVYKPGKKAKRANQDTDSDSSESSAKSPPKAPVNVLIPRWRPKHHTCGSCGAKVNSPQGRKTCIPKGHEAPCPRFHETLMMPHETAKCMTCKSHNESNLRRQATISALEEKIKSGKLDERNIAAAKKSVADMREENIKINNAERENTYLRELGYKIWRNGGRG